MSSNRLSYDDCAYTQRTGERVNPLTYQLFSSKHTLCQWCGDKHEKSKSELSWTERVTIENDLLNIDRKVSKCNTEKFQPSANPPEVIKSIFTPARLCDRNVVWTNLQKPTGTGLPDMKKESPVC